MKPIARGTPPLLALLFAAAGTAWAQPDEEVVGINLKSWFPTIRGRMFSDAAGSPGTSLDLRDDLDMSKADDGIGHFDVWVDIPAWPVRLAFSAYGGRFSENVILSSPVDFAGITFAAGPATEALLITRAYTLSAEWEPPIASKWIEDVRFEIVAGIQYASHDMELSQGATAASRRARALAPSLGARATWTVQDQFEVEATLTGWPDVEIADRTQRHFDLALEGRFVASPNFRFGVGVRVLNFLTDDRGADPRVDAVDAELLGFYVNASLRF